MTSLAAVRNILEVLPYRIVYQSIDSYTLRSIIRTALQPLDRWSQDAEEILMMIAAHESHLGQFIEQIGGPALGIYGMEPKTLQDNYQNYIFHRPDFKKAIAKNTGVDGPCFNSLQYNPIYSTIHARLKLWRSPGQLPNHYDIQSMADYAKKHYNSPVGKATAEKYIMDYRGLVLA